MSTEIEIQKFVETLVSNNETKMSLLDFFKNIHKKFFPDYDISFMQYFLELTSHRRKFVVHHEKLVEYGVMTAKNSARVKNKLDALKLVENKDFSLPNDVRAVGRLARNKTHQSIYAHTRIIQKVSYESSETAWTNG
jgi:hypothetical protein